MPSCATCERSFKPKERNGIDDRRGDGNGRRHRNAGAINDRRRCVEFMSVGRRRGSQPTRRHYTAGCVHDREARAVVFPNHAIRSFTDRRTKDVRVFTRPIFPNGVEGPRVLTRAKGDRRQSDHERRAVEPRRTPNAVLDGYFRRIGRSDRRGFTGQDSVRRMGLADRRDSEGDGRKFKIRRKNSRPNHPGRRESDFVAEFYGDASDDRVPGASTRRLPSCHLGQRNTEREDRRTDKIGDPCSTSGRARRLTYEDRRKPESNTPLIGLEDETSTFITTGRRKSTDERWKTDAPGKKLARYTFDVSISPGTVIDKVGFTVEHKERRVRLRRSVRCTHLHARRLGSERRISHPARIFAF